MKGYYLNNRILLSISLLIFIIDQTTKVIVVRILSLKSPIIFIPDLISLRLVKNKGAAFSLLSNSTFFLSLLSLIVTIFLVILILKRPPFSNLLAISLSFLLGGTIGNGFDRWSQGYVYDFIELIPIQFPIFNVADIAINIALICMFVDTLKKNNAKKYL